MAIITSKKMTLEEFVQRYHSQPQFKGIFVTYGHLYDHQDRVGKKGHTFITCRQSTVGKRMEWVDLGSKKGLNWYNKQDSK
jgi:hypothetical protein